MRSALFAYTGVLICVLLLALSDGAQALGTERILTTSDLGQPIFAGSPAGDDRLFILERTGEILIYNNGSLLGTPFLSINQVDTTGEGGLLGLAFPADYATSGLFYVYFTSASLTSRVSQFQVSVDPDIADASSELNFFSLSQPFNNHNGGTLAIRDGFLYPGWGTVGAPTIPVTARRTIPMSSARWSAGTSARAPPAAFKPTRTGCEIPSALASTA